MANAAPRENIPTRQPSTSYRSLSRSPSPSCDEMDPLSTPETSGHSRNCWGCESEHHDGLYPCPRQGTAGCEEPPRSALIRSWLPAPARIRCASLDCGSQGATCGLSAPASGVHRIMPTAPLLPPRETAVPGFRDHARIRAFKSLAGSRSRSCGVWPRATGPRSTPRLVRQTRSRRFGHRSFGVSPVRFAILPSMTGPISSSS